MCIIVVSEDQGINRAVHRHTTAPKAGCSSPGTTLQPDRLGCSTPCAPFENFNSYEGD